MGYQEIAIIVAIFAVLFGGPWIIRRLAASVRELRNLGGVE